ncbi:hypothetical protein OSB04_018602 [Centaurea solstitialis]|uniref:Alpha-glucan water dikinase n=1 Tax=Centaurea solstitialis TaxID=347529 RepID=A0AA38WAN4_9ASTR|nr:hypothetical protein OSB04_018602 [Centaurea solstitialis]
MSNSVGHGLLQPRVLKHQSQKNYSTTCIAGNTLFQAQVTYQIRKPLLPSLSSYRLTLRKSGLRTNGVVSGVVQAVLTTDQTSEQLREKYILGGDIEMQVDVKVASVPLVEIQVTNSGGNLYLHWGGIQNKKEKWVLPGRRPEGTKVYKERALRTPFVKSGSNLFLKVEIDDPSVQALEFLIVDEANNKWYKNNGQNFHVKLPSRENPVSNVVVPEDLVQIQAFLRWEKKGKQMYTPEQEKASKLSQILDVAFIDLLDGDSTNSSIWHLREHVEYEAARAELYDEIARGSSIEDLRARLTKKDGTGSEQTGVSEPSSTRKSDIPDDLAQLQAYIRWEKAGKPNFSADQQLIEFEEARKDLQKELEKGTSLDDIRKRITKGEKQTNVQKQQEKRSNSSHRIQRKKRDLMQLLNKHIPVSVKSVEEKVSMKPKTLSAVELYCKDIEEQKGITILNKKTYKLGDEELLVLATKVSSKIRVHLATGMKEPLTLHWALSKKPGEWLAPPENLLPEGSTSLVAAADTQFSTDGSANKIQLLEIEIGEGGFVGMPFVLFSGKRWIKNNGSDFYVEFAGPKKAIKDASDGKGTAKNLLDRIAGLESEAQKSFMHRFNIAADLMEEAKDTGELGFAAILVWMRFMATRQLIWNKNYNVKPREISRAQDRLTDLLQNVYVNYPQYSELLRMIMSTVGRGGEGDVGQRIRDEILVIQRNNDCAGGMMEEWHQKLHNNTSPDDVVICQALIDYIKNDFDLGVYWNTLNTNGITKERLLSYDRAIHHEPTFRRDQKDSLLRDLGNYMRTLKAVHSGADLESAISNCMGYKSEVMPVSGQGFMVGVNINPVSGLPSGFPELLQFVLEHVEDKNVETLLEVLEIFLSFLQASGLLEAREELRPLLSKSNDRLKDLLFLDIALDSTVRTAIERSYESLNNAEPERVMYLITLLLENLILSSDNNEDLIYCLKE